MLADRLKARREAKSWSQGHLADAAGLNIRTVQRIEAGEPASCETLLALAAALDINVSELETEADKRTTVRGLSRRRAAMAATFVAPATVFITVNLLRSVAGIDGPFDMLAGAGGRLMSFRTFNLISPIILLGGATAAFLICLPAMVTLRTNRIGRTAVSINGMEVRGERAPLILAIAGVLSAGILLSYAALELLRTPLP